MDVSQQALKNGVSFYIQVETLNNRARKLVALASLGQCKTDFLYSFL